MVTEINVEKLRLAHGAHTRPEQGMCVMELAAYLSPTSEFTDHPACVSPVIGAFLRNWNDSLDDDARQMLKPYAAKVLNTATGAEDDKTRAWLATDWLAREYAPAWLRLAGLTEQAETLERLAALTNAGRAKEAQPKITAAAAAAWAAARDAAWAAAWDAAADAAWAAARAAAGAAAADAAWAAARAAAGAAAGAAAADAAWDAARAAAGDAAADAAWAAARAAAGAAAADAARDTLVPTTKGLQKSALLLLDRMIEIGRA